jgi:hypothetical protein
MRPPRWHSQCLAWRCVATTRSTVGWPGRYAMFVEPGVHTFVAAGDAVFLTPALVGLGWDMVAVADGTVVGSGYDVMTLDDDGRILLDHQHILSEPRSSSSANHRPEQPA